MYNVHAQSRPKLLLISYTLHGEPKYPRADDVDGRRAVETHQGFEAAIARDAFASMKRDNPMAYQYMGMLMLGKQLGIKLDAPMLKGVDDDADDENDWAETLIREKIRRDPEFKDTYLQAAMEARFGKKREG